MAGLRLAFFGSPDFAVPALRALAAAGHDIVAVYTQPPRPAHRGQALTRSAVHAAADALGLPVRTPARLKANGDEHAFFAGLSLDAAVVAAYGLILPPVMLDAPRRGCINIHASLLPRWRGAAPIHRAIEAGDTQSGITIMRMAVGLDTGPMLSSAAVPIGPHTTTPALHDELARLGAALILKTLEQNPPAVPQPDDGVTYASKLTRTDGALDFSRDAAALDRQVRAMVPWPGCTALFRGERLKILAAEPAESEGGGGGEPGAILDDSFTVATGRGALRLTLVQRAGRPAIPGADFLRGAQPWRGLALGRG
jgi:methionyl-tRNA formyltransferase